ncbi:MAG: molybdopterin molybdotransferase MoeA [Maricaulis sp.]|jgi:molybdopterin molybdotransferase|nr:molybdopterin molybdotransferase MoeA [Maricaulis sp.]
MITVDEARAEILAALSPCGLQSIPSQQAAGHTLAIPLIAARTQPPFPASAMDGYAVRSEDLSDTPAVLHLQGEAAAGHAHAGCVAPGTAVRISTGAPVPAGADQVVIQENTTRDGDRLTLKDTPRPSSNIRHAGTDFSDGDTLLPIGTRLNPTAIALAVGAGAIQLEVYRRPRIGILSTGDELVEPGETTADSQIINSISRGLDGLVRQWGGEPVYLGIARDTPEDVQDKLATSAGLDLLVTIGGASVGDHDHLRSTFAAMGGTLLFEKVAVKPGKPTWFGKLKGVHCLGLPGNPVSAFVTARLFLSAAMASLCGRPHTIAFQNATLGIDLEANGRREIYIRGARSPGDGSVAPLVQQDSSALSALAQSDILIRRVIDAPAAAVGETVEVLPLD